MRPQQSGIRSVRTWHEGPARRYASRCRCEAGRPALLNRFPATRAVIFTAAPPPAPACRRTPGSGDPAASSLPNPPLQRPGPVRYNCALWPGTWPACHAHCGSGPRARPGQCPRQPVLASFPPCPLSAGFKKVRRGRLPIPAALSARGPHPPPERRPCYGLAPSTPQGAALHNPLNFLTTISRVLLATR